MNKIMKDIRREYLEEKAHIWEIEKVALSARDFEYREMDKETIRQSYEKVFGVDSREESSRIGRRGCHEELMKRVQRGLATVDVRGGVYTLEEPEIGAEAHYLGTIPRKMIPNRRKLEQRELRALEERLAPEEKVKERPRISERDLIAGGCPTNAVGIAMLQLRHGRFP